jgi:hypothetical protein
MGFTLPSAHKEQKKVLISVMDNRQLVHPVHKRVALLDNTLKLTPDAGDEFVTCEQVTRVDREAFCA